MILHAAWEGIPSETSSEKRLSADFGSPNPSCRRKKLLRTGPTGFLSWGPRERDMEPLGMHNPAGGLAINQLMKMKARDSGSRGWTGGVRLEARAVGE